ncbi:MAG TPA: hypothetical protein VGL59_00275 [Polyangia bacterium]
MDAALRLHPEPKKKDRNRNRHTDTKPTLIEATFATIACAPALVDRAAAGRFGSGAAGVTSPTMSASPDQGPPASPESKLPKPGLAAFVVATLAAVIVGLAKYDEMSVNNTGGPLAMLRPIVSVASAALTWIVAFPIVWLVVRRLRRPKKEDVPPRHVDLR